MNCNSTRPRTILAIILMLSAVSFYTLIATSATTRTMPRPVGELLVTGHVTLNGLAAIPGITICDESRVKIARDGAATVSLGKLGRLELKAEAEMILRLSESQIGGNLIAGQVIVSAPAGVGISVLTAHGTAASDGNQAAMLAVEVKPEGARVAVSDGEARFTSGNKVDHIAAGKELAVGAPAAGEGGNSIPLTAPGTEESKDRALAGGPRGAAGLAALLKRSIKGAWTSIASPSPGLDASVIHTTPRGLRIERFDVNSFP